MRRMYALFIVMVGLGLTACGSENSTVKTPPANADILESISIQASSTELVVNDPLFLNIIGNYADGSQKAVTDEIIRWQSSNATVLAPSGTSPSQSLTALATGQVAISATHDSAGSAAVIINVTAVVDPPVTGGDFVINVKKPDGWAGLSLYIWGDNNIEPRGSWPGTSLAAVDGWYTTTVSASEFSDTGFPNMIFNDGQPNTSVQSPNITNRNTTGWYDVDSNTWTLTKPNTPVVQPPIIDPPVIDPPVVDEPGTFSVFFAKQDNWQQTNVYIWNDEGETRGGWPGESIQLDDDNWFRVIVDEAETNNGTVNIIFNDGDSQKTPDLTRSSLGYYDLASNSWSDVNPNGDQYAFAITGGVASASGTVTAGALITITANQPETGFEFVQWEGAGNAAFGNVQSASTTFTMPNANVSLRALFAPVGDEFALGRSYYQSDCARCHGAEGDGVGTYPALTNLSSRYTLETLSARIAGSMPPAFAGGPQDCEGTCAAETAKIILANEFTLAVSCNDGLTPSDRQVRLLSLKEYENTLADLLGSHGLNTSLVPDTSSFEGFDNAATAAVTESHVSGYLSIAAEAGEQFTLSNLANRFGSCNGGDANCQINTFGERVFRRPLTSAETARYNEINNEHGGGAVISALLASSNFLYRSETGVASNPSGNVATSSDFRYYQLTDFEIASLLSYTFWGTMPSEYLLTQARNGQLHTKAQISQAMNNHILNDARAQERYADFAEGWLHISDLRNREHVSDSLATALQGETREFVSQLAFDDATLTDLYSANYTYLNATLASHYGFGQADGSQYTKANYTEGERKGLLGHGSILARTGLDENQGNVITRGLFVRENLLCQDLGNPPPNAGNLPDKSTFTSNREFFGAHANDQGCSFCHQYIDPIGFGTENFDGLGRFQTQENFNNNINELTGLGSMANMEIEGAAAGQGETQDFQYVSGLADLLADSANAKGCYVRQYYRYMTGEMEIDNHLQSEDACTLQSLSQNFKNGNVTLKQQLIEMTQSDVFTVRKSRR